MNSLEDLIDVRQVIDCKMLSNERHLTVSQQVHETLLQIVKSNYLSFQAHDLTMFVEDPADLFTVEEIRKIASLKSNMRFALFCSYYCDGNPWQDEWLLKPLVNFKVYDETDMALFGIYARKALTGNSTEWPMEAQEILLENPNTIVWVIPEVFRAIVGNHNCRTLTSYPELETDESEPQLVQLGGELLTIQEASSKMHCHIELPRLTRHIVTNHQMFIEALF